MDGWGIGGRVTEGGGGGMSYFYVAKGVEKSEAALQVNMCNNLCA